MKNAKKEVKKRVSDCDLIPIVQCFKHHSVLEAAKKLKEQNSRYLVVLDGHTPIGIISPSDITSKVVAENKNPINTRVEDIMTSPIFILRWDEPIHIALVAMLERGLLLCPVIDSDYKCLGLVSLSELVNKSKK
jgi:CBS domain-containing protein